MVKRFNGRVSNIVNHTRSGSAAELESTLRNYVKIYNHTLVSYPCPWLIKNLRVERIYLNVDRIVY
jgi:hypothetical protein